MLILTLRTDNPEAELGLYDDQEKLGYEKWQAHRQLAETIHLKIDEMLNKSSKSLDDLGGIVCFKGPGSFTGLRIGLSVANALAYSLKIPIVGTKNADWIEQGIKALGSGTNEQTVMPEYNSAPHITPPRK